MNSPETLVDAGKTGDSSTPVITKCYYYRQWVLQVFLLSYYCFDIVLNIITIVKIFINYGVLLGSVSIGICFGSEIVATVISARIAADSHRDHESGDVGALSRYERFVLYIRSGELLSWFKFCVFQLAVPHRHLLSLAFMCKAYQLQEKKKDLSQGNNNNVRTKKGRCKGKNKGRTNTRTKKNEANYLAAYQRMHKEDRNIASISLVNCCFKTAPLFILQMSLQLNQTEPITFFVLMRRVGWCWNIIMLGWSMRSIHITSRLTDTARKELPCVSSLWVFIGHTGTMGARLILISVGASMWPQETLEACLFIGVAWFVWLHWKADARYAFCLKKTETFGDVFCSCVVAVVYILTFVNLKKGSTCCRQFVYSMVNLFLNGVSLYVIRSYATISESFTLILLYISIGTLYIFGIVASLIYYTCSHPSRQVTTCCKHLHDLFENSNFKSSVENDAADESVSSQGSESDNHYTSLDVLKFDKLPLRFDRVLNKVLDLIGQLPMQDSPFNEVDILHGLHIPVSSNSGAEMTDNESDNSQ